MEAWKTLGGRAQKGAGAWHLASHVGALRGVVEHHVGAEHPRVEGVAARCGKSAAVGGKMANKWAQRQGVRSQNPGVS